MIGQFQISVLVCEDYDSLNESTRSVLRALTKSKTVPHNMSCDLGIVIVTHDHLHTYRGDNVLSFVQHEQPLLQFDGIFENKLGSSGVIEKIPENSKTDAKGTTKSKGFSNDSSGNSFMSARAEDSRQEDYLLPDEVMHTLQLKFKEKEEEYVSWQESLYIPLKVFYSFTF